MLDQHLGIATSLSTYERISEGHHDSGRKLGSLCKLHPIVSLASMQKTASKQLKNMSPQKKFSPLLAGLAKNALLWIAGCRYQYGWFSLSNHSINCFISPINGEKSGREKSCPSSLIEPELGWCHVSKRPRRCIFSMTTYAQSHKNDLSQHSGPGLGSSAAPEVFCGLGHNDEPIKLHRMIYPLLLLWGWFVSSKLHKVLQTELTFLSNDIAGRYHTGVWVANKDKKKCFVPSALCQRSSIFSPWANRIENLFVNTIASVSSNLFWIYSGSH